MHAVESSLKVFCSRVCFLKNLFFGCPILCLFCIKSKCLLGLVQRRNCYWKVMVYIWEHFFVTRKRHFFFKNPRRARCINTRFLNKPILVSILSQRSGKQTPTPTHIPVLHALTLAQEKSSMQHSFILLRLVFWKVQSSSWFGHNLKTDVSAHLALYNFFCCQARKNYI